MSLMLVLVSELLLQLSQPALLLPAAAAPPGPSSSSKAAAGSPGPSTFQRILLGSSGKVQGGGAPAGKQAAERTQHPVRFVARSPRPGRARSLPDQVAPGH
jgi:hypothetical protein